MVNRERHRGVSTGTGDIYEVDAVVIFAGPYGNPGGVAAIVLDDVFDKIVDEDMFPGDEDGGILVRRFFQLGFKAFDLEITKFRVDRKAATNGGGFNGHKRANVIVTGDAIYFFSWIGGKDELGLAEFFQQNIGQGESAVEAAATELAEAGGGLFAMADANKGFHGGTGSGGRIGLSGNAKGKQKEQHEKYFPHAFDFIFGRKFCPACLHADWINAVFR